MNSTIPSRTVDCFFSNLEPNQGGSYQCLVRIVNKGDEYNYYCVLNLTGRVVFLQVTLVRFIWQ